MEPLFYVMAILGCGDGNTACTEARIVPAHYASMAACRAALPVQLARNTDVDYPQIGAACRSAGVAVASVSSRAARKG